MRLEPFVIASWSISRLKELFLLKIKHLALTFLLSMPIFIIDIWFPSAVKAYFLTADVSKFRNGVMGLLKNEFFLLKIL